MKKTISILFVALFLTLFTTACGRTPNGGGPTKDEQLQACGDGKLDPWETCDVNGLGVESCTTQQLECLKKPNEGSLYYFWEVDSDNTCKSKCIKKEATCDTKVYDDVCPASCNETTDLDCAAIGSPCVRDGQCKSIKITTVKTASGDEEQVKKGAGHCLQADPYTPGRYKDGYCTLICDGNGSNGECPEGSRCVDSHACLKICQANSDCRDGYECKVPAAGGAKVCLQKEVGTCTKDTDCTGKEIEAPYTALKCMNSLTDDSPTPVKHCMPTYSTATIAQGGECSQDSDCQGAYAVCVKGGKGLAKGICTQACGDDLPTVRKGNKTCTTTDSTERGYTLEKCDVNTGTCAGSHTLCSRIIGGNIYTNAACVPSVYKIGKACDAGSTAKCDPNPFTGSLDKRACVGLTKKDGSQGHVCSVLCQADEECLPGSMCVGGSATKLGFCVIPCGDQQPVCPSGLECGKYRFCVPK